MLHPAVLMPVRSRPKPHKPSQYIKWSRTSQLVREEFFVVEAVVTFVELHVVELEVELVGYGCVVGAEEDGEYEVVADDGLENA